MREPDNSGQLQPKAGGRDRCYPDQKERDIFRVLNMGSENFYILSHMKIMTDSSG